MSRKKAPWKWNAAACDAQRIRNPRFESGASDVELPAAWEESFGYWIPDDLYGMDVLPVQLLGRGGNGAVYSSNKTSLVIKVSIDDSEYTAWKKIKQWQSRGAPGAYAWPKVINVTKQIAEDGLYEGDSVTFAFREEVAVVARRQPRGHSIADLSDGVSALFNTWSSVGSEIEFRLNHAASKANREIFDELKDGYDRNLESIGNLGWQFETLARGALHASSEGYFFGDAHIGNMGIALESKPGRPKGSVIMFDPGVSTQS